MTDMIIAMPPTSRLLRAASLVAAAMLALLPFHALLTVSLSGPLGHYTALRLWKEGLLAALVVLVGIMAAREQTWRRWTVLGRPSRNLLLASGLYLACCLAGYAYGRLSGRVSPLAGLYGLLLDARFVIMLLVVWFVAGRDRLPGRYWQRLILVPAALVVVFGLLQFFALPSDFLKHLNYRPDTIAASQTVDQKAGYQRIQSTLRGANPLGAYLVVILSLLGGLLMKRRSVWLALYFVGACTALLLTFSRSAWLGAGLALGLLLLSAIGRLPRRPLFIAGAVLVVAFGVTGFVARNNNVFQNLVFHTDETSQSAESSNQGHAEAVRGGLRDIVRRPLGNGVGSAGPASVYNGPGQTRIAEDQYIQLGQEMGVFGVAAFVLLLLCLGRLLWERRGSLLGRSVLASLVGLSVVGLLSHVWADDTLAYVWWGLAGIALVRPAGNGDNPV